MHLFYTPGINSTEYTLTEEESKHCVRVLRLKVGDPVYLIDGVGGLYYAKISDDHPKRCTVSVYQTIKDYGKRNYHLTIAIAPTKNIDRFEWFLEKATEIGIDRIIPFISEQSERKIVKPDRLNKIINAAMKQSKQAYLPKLEELCNFDDLMKFELPEKKFIAHCFDEEKFYLKKELQKHENAVVLIGPEGDFTLSEVEKAIEKGFRPVTLGNNRLRTETAGIVAVHTIAMINY
jgi:16S rRNA (uracil1498-N3)-methyltransferase